MLINLKYIASLGAFVFSTVALGADGFKKSKCETDTLTDFGVQMANLNRELQKGSGVANDDRLHVNAVSSKSVWFNYDFAPELPGCLDKYSRVLSRLGIKFDQEDKNNTLTFVSRTAILKQLFPDSEWALFLAKGDLGLTFTHAKTPLVFETGTQKVVVDDVDAKEYGYEFRFSPDPGRLGAGGVNFGGFGYIKYTNSKIPVLVIYSDAASKTGYFLVKTPNVSAVTLGVRSKTMPENRLGFGFELDAGVGVRSLKGHGFDIYDPTIEKDFNSVGLVLDVGVGVGATGRLGKGSYWALTYFFQGNSTASPCSGNGSTGSFDCSATVYMDQGVRGSLAFQF